MERRARRSFDANYKRNALRMILDEGVPLEEVARKLDINRLVIHRWKKAYQENPDGAFPGQGNHTKGIEEENQQLKQALKDAEEERDILKKALTIF